MFGNSEDRSLLVQAACKRYFEKNVHVSKRFNDGDMAFIDRPKHELKTTKERDEQIAKSKLLPKSSIPFRVIRDYSDVIVIDQAGAKLPVSLEHCSKVPAENKAPDNPNLESDITNPGFPFPPIVKRTRCFSPKNPPIIQPKRTLRNPLQIARQKLDPKPRQLPTASR